MAQLVKAAQAGFDEKNDALVTVEPIASGIEIELTSKVMRQYGDQIKSVILNTVKEAGFDDVYAILEKTETQNQVIMKGGQPIETVKREFGSYLDKVLYMPVIDLGNKEAEKIITDYLKELRPAAFEIIYSDPKNPLPPKIKQLLFKKSLIWYNTLWGSLAGNHDDNLALTDPEKSYGYLIEQLGARILQTDQPAYLLDYLRKKGWHN